MKKYWTTLLMIAMAAGSFAQGRKVVFVIVDGIAADVIEKQPTPFLDDIAKAGRIHKSTRWWRKRRIFANADYLCGGIQLTADRYMGQQTQRVDNDIKAPNYNYWTLFRFLKEQFPQKKTAVFSSWEDNRTKLVGENLPAIGAIKLTHHFDGLELDTSHYPHDRNRDFMHRIDEAVVENAVDLIRKEAPDTVDRRAFSYRSAGRCYKWKIKG